MTYFDILMSVLKWTTALTTASAVLVSAGLYVFQSSLIYPASFPSGSRTTVSTPDQFGMSDFEQLHLTAPDGTVLHCYLIPASSDAREARRRPTVMLFHANAGNMGHRLPIAKRGYGKSTGSPSESGIRSDAQTALSFILQHPTLSHTPLFAYGQSIGGAIAIDLVSRNASRFAGLVVENTFLSISSLIPTVLPIATPLTPLCREKWRSIDLVSEIIDVPILFLSGAADALVPPAQMRALYDACQATGKRWREYPLGTHNDTVAQRGYMNDVFDFIQDTLQSASMEKGGSEQNERQIL